MTQFNVVTKTLVGASRGVMTRTSFANETAFDEWYKSTMNDGTNRPLREVYGVVAKGISEDEAAEIISSTDNYFAVQTAHARELTKMLLSLRG